MRHAGTSSDCGTPRIQVSPDVSWSAASWLVAVVEVPPEVVRHLLLALNVLICSDSSGPKTVGGCGSHQRWHEAQAILEAGPA